MCVNWKKEKFESYKKLNYENGVNYLESLSLDILQTIRDWRELNETYKYCRNEIVEKEGIKCFETTLNIGFNHIKWLYWLQFCNQMRDYSSIIFELTGMKTNNKQNKIKYKEITQYIYQTKFINGFLIKDNSNVKNIGDLNIFSFQKYNALSFTMHNFNTIEFGKLKSNEIFRIYDDFNKLIATTDFNDLKEEFIAIINLFRKVENYDMHINLVQNHSIIPSLLRGLLDYRILKK